MLSARLIEKINTEWGYNMHIAGEEEQKKSVLIR
jgi:hypothetical protein